MAASDTRGFTLIELLSVMALIAILAMLGTAGMAAARRAANEASAIASLRVINLAQHAYASSCANGYYASSLPMLASPPPGGSAFISPELGADVTVYKSGFAIEMARGTDSTPANQPACNPLWLATDVVSAYYATADPVNAFTGSQHFWTNTLGVIYVDPDAPILHQAGLTSPPAGSPPVGGANASGTGRGTDTSADIAPPEAKPESKETGSRSPQRR